MIKQSVTLGLMLIAAVMGFAHADQYDDAVFQLNRGEYNIARELLTPLAEDGFAPAQYQLALIYKNGFGVSKDLDMTVNYLTKSADKNYPDALFDLAILYSEGTGVKKDLAKAFKLTEKAANKEVAAAQFNLGVMYYQGTGTPKNYLTASRWYQRAAEQNYALAQFNLALMYFEGQGVEKSLEMSYIWNSIAASNGYPSAATSRDMDSHKLTAEQILIANDKLDTLMQKIQNQVALKAKMAQKVKFY
jgi:uncharacterized protein